MLKKKNHYLFNFFIYALLSFSSPLFADEINQGPISTVNPANLIPAGTDNQIYPDQSYKEYGTDNSPMRTPILFDTSQCTNGACHYPTNRWFTDLIFTAITDANGAGNNFAVAQSPYDIAVFDDVTTGTTAGNESYFTMLPGLYFRFNLPTTIVSTTEKPYEYNLNGDMYYPYLMSPPTNHFMFTMPNKINSFNPKTERKILYYDPLSLTTKWTLTNGDYKGGNMTAYIVRGSPYITLSYNNLPIILRTVASPGLIAIAVDKQAPQRLNPSNFGDTFTGSTFRIMLAVDDFSTGDKQKTPFYIRYFEYILFSSSPITLEWANRQSSVDPAWVLQTTTSYTGIIRMAYAGADTPESSSIPDIETKALAALQNGQFASAEAMLDKYKDTYPTGVDIKLNSDNNKGSVIFDWKTSSMSDATTGSLLMMAFEKNQQPYLSGITPGDDATYRLMTIRGPMVPVIGNEWTLSVPYSEELYGNNLWYGSKRVPAQYQDELKAALKGDIAWLDKPNGYGRPNLAIGARNDSYAFGKQVARVARLALIADELGDTQSRDIALSKIKEALSLWFPKTEPEDKIGSTQSYMRYDDKFGGIVTARAASNPNNCQKDGIHLKNQCGYQLDFYNGQYTDHHFHYGYFLYSAAVLAKFDPVWLSQYKESINLLARDLANPTAEQDPYFTQYRYFDWFEGHAFANGLGPGGDGRNQESTSEGINAWYGLTLWGEVTGNKDLANTARIMTMLEARAAQDWTQIPSGDGKSIYDPFYANTGSENNSQPINIKMSDLIVSGINWSLKIDHTTFFGLIKSYLIGIQLMPYTPISNALISSDWLASQNSSGKNALQDSVDGLITKIDYYQLANNTRESIFGKFLAEWPDFAERNPKAIEKDYWIQVEGRLNGAYQWGLNSIPALAIINPDLAYQYLAFNTNGLFFNAMQQANDGFLKEALDKNGIVTLDGISTNRQCQAVDGNVKLYCYLYDNIQSSIGWPIAKLDYDGMDKGETVTNLLWWTFTHQTNTSKPNPPALFWLYDDPHAINLSGSSATITWEPSTIINSTGTLHYTVQINGNTVCETDTTSCQLSKLQPDKNYIAIITVTDKEGKILFPNTKTVASITKYVNFRTLSSGMTSIIRFNGSITKVKTSDTSVNISWNAAMLCNADDPNNCQPSSNIGYQVKSDDQSKIYCGETPDQQTTCGLTNLDTNATYHLWILAIETTGKAQTQQLPYTFQVNDEPAELTWGNPNVTAVPDVDKVSITWHPATLIPAGTIHYTATVSGPHTCNVDNATGCEINSLPPGHYSVIVTANADPNLNINSPAVDFEIMKPINPSLSWSTGATATATVQGKSATISWQPAILKDATGSINYHVALSGTSGCTATDNLSCVIDISGLKAGDYTASVSASSGTLIASGGPTTTFSVSTIPPVVRPVVQSVCRPLRPPVAYITLAPSSSSLSIASIFMNGSPLTLTRLSDVKYRVNLVGAANPLTIIYSDGTPDKNNPWSITASQSCQ